ncbi:MAG TPA: response regulator [Planctomycetota bacterium]|nr:response regulator [Planctomycetota bacterium]
MDGEPRVNILVVDDRPDKVLSLGAVLEDLGQNVVKAHSGDEALRALLKMEFAVILLDVNMPGMDGFETASLIRQRQSSRTTPIIFITAFGDETHVARGYSLGAVDYILAPVLPEVLRSKVLVFVDLHKKTEQVKRQAQWLEERALQLHKLTLASVSINSAPSIEKMLQVVTDSARDILGAHMAATIMSLGRNWSQAMSAVSLSEKHRPARSPDGEVDSGSAPSRVVLTPLESVVCHMQKSLRLSEGELNSHPAWQGAKLGGPEGSVRPTLRGWVGAPLYERSSRNMGLVELSDKQRGDFTAEDEAVLNQLAQVASIAIDNALSAEAREANRLKDEFLATLSHELRTPLNAILGWAKILKMDHLPAADTARGLEVIERNVRVQTRLIEDLLDISRINSDKLRINLRRTSLSAVIQSAIDSVRPDADAKEILLEPGLIPVEDELFADQDRLQQVIWNLLSNAIKFTPPKGRVEVRVERAPGVLEVRVSDSGRGIAPEFLPHVFERFRQADSQTTRVNGGLGLGLAIARHIVELHGGTVRVESHGEGRGATFTVSLPSVLPRSDIAGPPPGAGAPAARSFPTVLHEDPTTLPGLPQGMPATVSGLLSQPRVQTFSTLWGVRVLLVDDEPDSREILAEVFRRQQAEVTAVASVAEALQAMDRVLPHILLSDIAMPGEDGYSLIRRVRKRPGEDGGKVPAVALTAFARDEDRIQALAAGFQAHMAKPVDITEVLALVAELTGQGERGSSPPLNRVSS